MVVLITAAFIYFVYFSETKDELIEQNLSFSSECLSENLEVSYVIENENVPLVDVIINISDKETKKELLSFGIKNIRKNYYPIELHKCGIYVTRMFNYDPQKTKQEPGFKTELWKYDYNGIGKSIILFNEKIDDNGQKAYKSYYNQDFRIDIDEKYIVLNRRTIIEFNDGDYIDQEDYSFAVKDLKTKEDVFVLSYNDLIDKYSAPEGSLALGNWSNDGRYFLGIIHIAAKTLAFFRIDTDNWKVDVLAVPEEAPLVGTINETGEYITYDNGPGWIGIYEMEQQIHEEWRKEGKKVSLFLYNLFTKEKITLATINDPGWDFKVKWISDTELEYYLPSGEKQIFIIERGE